MKSNENEILKDTEKKAFFPNELLKWFHQNDRPLPWKGEQNPYYIWLSEIILQQTRVEQGLPYFLKFKAAFPTIQDLAKAPEDKVLKLWEGLGYYSRARNLHETAKHITTQYKGIFPDNYKDILALKGVGPYTAAAIASFAYNLPYAVVDGNVYRVLARFFGIDTPIDTTQGKRLFQGLAQDLLIPEKAGIYNQAIMDFGATQCTPKSPNCLSCPLTSNCAAFEHQTTGQLPVKSKKLVKKNRFFNYVLFKVRDEVLIQKRTDKDIWKGLYEFPLIETEQLITSVMQLQQQEKWQSWQVEESIQFIGQSKMYKQTLTHQHIKAIFWVFELSHFSKTQKQFFVDIKSKKLQKFAFPKIIDLYFKDKTLYLPLF